jgi:hypothetical protein
MKNSLMLILSISILCISSRPLMAEETPKTDTTGSKKTDIDKVVEQTPSAITLGVVDGIIRYVKNERRVKIRLLWEPIPPTPSLVERANSSEFEVTTIEISNEDIKSGDWSRNISNEKKIKLSKALNVPISKGLILKNEIRLKDFQRGLKVSDYINMQRERNILKVLLLSGGVQYSFRFKSNENPIVPPDFSDEDITWQINIYSFKDEEQQEQEFYRFTAKAVVKPFEKKITGDFIDASGSKEKVLYDVRFKLKKSDAISSIANNLFLLPTKDSVFELPDKPTDTEKEALGTKMTEQTAKAALTSLGGFFSFFGGSDQFGTAVQGILGGTEDTSIVSGGLVGFKDGSISPFIGINQEVGQLGDDISGSILLGVGLGEKTSLFLGPSIRSSIFTLSAGATLGTQSNSEVNFGGMIGIDLSRFTNSKKDPAPIKVISSSQGGGLGQRLDDKYDKYTVVEYESDRTITMTRVCDENSVRIPNSKQSKIFKTTTKKTKEYIIRGFYQFKSKDGKKDYYDNYTSDTLIKREGKISGDLDQSGTLTCSEPKASTSDNPSK